MVGLFHRHKPQYQETYETKMSGFVQYRVYVYNCECGMVGQLELHPNPDARIHWRKVVILPKDTLSIDSLHEEQL